ncbi:MAG: hypothetical protein MK207_00750 [Saprospiraceae bacterium]|nr:hypothetical protein [Saprospiraceae bacterium]
MKCFLLALSFLLCLFTFSYAQFPITVNEIEVTSNAVVEYDGNLEDGRKITDLSWASRSSVACFPSTQNSKFDGNHVQHGFVLPANSEVSIILEPHNRKAEFSMYAYQVSTSQYPVVPNLYFCRSCEADYKWDYPKKGLTQDHTRTIKMNSFQDSYNVFVGVAGANGLEKCDYTLKIYIKTSEKPMFNQAKIKVFKAASEPNKTKYYKGDLSDGVQVHDLSWASSSSNACFPSTQNSKFTGNHIMYVTHIPEYSEMDITLVPDDPNADMSIYAFETAETSNSMVPNLVSCITCEADYKWDYPRNGESQDHSRSVHLNAIKNPYRVVIGVAGADGLTNGSFILKIKTDTRVLSNQSQQRLKVYRAKAAPNETKFYRGSLKDGVQIHDLTWASSSSNACFPGTQNSKYSGNHIIYITEIPAYSKMDITVAPNDQNANMSVYAFMNSLNSDAMVPNLSSCISCEADHKWDYPKKGQTQNHTRTISLNSTNRPYRVVIGVAGADSLVEGDFIVKIKTMTNDLNNQPQKPLKLFSANSEKGKTKGFMGNLADGVKVHDLSWASLSSVACFPETQNSKFTGNHILYITDIPAYSKMEITVVPEDKNANMSIYAYMTSSDNKSMIPKLKTCISCEAEYKWDYPKSGQIQDHTRSVNLNSESTSNRVVIGIVGANGLTEGKYILKIKTE